MDLSQHALEAKETPKEAVHYTRLLALITYTNVLADELLLCVQCIYTVHISA